MTVKELIAALQQCDPGDLVVLSTDPEGNSFRALQELSLDLYLKPRSPWGTGEIEEREQQASFPGAVPCVTLWPK